MIEELLPDDVVVVEALSDPPEAVLFPAEEALLAQAVEKRRLEFTTVRHCARVALGRLGVPAVPILPGEHGAPQWPEGIVGSMTHCVGYRAAVVARSADVVTVGVDAEPHEALPPEVLDTVTLPEERGQLVRLTATRPGVHWDRLLFSAKEAVYKSWYPLTRSWLDFDEASIAFDGGSGGIGGGGGVGVEAAGAGAAAGAGSEAKSGSESDGASGTFYARLLVPGPVVDGVRLPGFAGRWLVRGGLLFTAIALPADGVARSVAAGAESADAAAVRLP